MNIIQVEPIMRDESRGARLPHEEAYASGSSYLNGKYCPFAQASIPLMDLGFLQSDVTYEKVTVAKGRYFRLEDHFARFARSCAKFYLRNPHSNEQMVEIFNKLIRLTGLKNAGLFWCVTRGILKEVSDRNNPDAFENRFYAAVNPYGSIATEAQRKRGLNVMISGTYIRIPAKAVDPTVKNFNGQDMKMSLFEARRHGRDSSVLTDVDGYLTEAPGANIFVVKGGELYTPDSGGLEGITRKTTLELAEMIGIPTHVERVHARQLRDADDAFITSTAGGIMPINSVDGVLLGGVEGPGEISLRLHNLYWEKMWDGWKCTPVDYSGGPNAD